MPRMSAALMFLVPALALGQGTGAPLVGAPRVVNAGPGDQTDPHVSGQWVVYTNQPGRNISEIHYHHLLTGLDATLPTEGGFDALADIQGTQVVFTRTTATNRIYRFDVRTGGVAEELAPRADTDRRAATVGGHTVAWQELGAAATALPPEIHVYNQDTLKLTRLTSDTGVDRTPAVSEDGRVVAWSKCATSVDGCDIWVAREFPEGYQVRQLTGMEGEEIQPDTNGQFVVYVTNSPVNGVLESDIAWIPLAGGEAQRLSLPGTDTNPSISGPLIAFEHWETTSSTPNYDIRLYDLRTQTTYRLTETPASESLSDISWDEQGHVRVAWTRRENGDLNLYAYEFRLPTECRPVPGSPSAEAVCAAPGTRQLQGVLQVTRSQEEPVPLSTRVSGYGTGVLCVDNGHEGSATSSGWVWLGEGVAADPNDFTEAPTGLARRIPLQGSRPLSAQIQGALGSAFRVRLYGPLMCDVAAQDASFQPTEVRQGENVPKERLGIRFGRAGGAHYFVSSGDEGRPPRP
jgi:Tol biopolymer transport system component